LDNVKTQGNGSLGAVGKAISTRLASRENSYGQQFSVQFSVPPDASGIASVSLIALEPWRTQLTWVSASFHYLFCPVAVRWRSQPERTRTWRRRAITYSFLWIRMAWPRWQLSSIF